jgi:hypothetical protein
MKTGKKVCIAVLSVLVLVACAVGIIRSTTFPMDPATLPDHICDFYNIGRPQPLSPSIRVYDSVELENTVWYLMEIGEDIDLGYVKLERNFLGRYKIVSLGYGGSFRDGVVRSGEKAYYLFGGRDVTGRIAKITMTQNGETCTMENAEGKTHFLFCTELSPQLGDYDFDRSTLRFYDKDGNDITAEYNLNGGGIA